MRSKVSRAALQGHARGSCMLMAPGAPSCEEAIRGLSPPLPPNCSSWLFIKDLVVTETLGPCLSLEPLVNLRSGSWPPSSTTVPKALVSH
ncbi:hypothetical protein D623_10020643 [Myotis brandtii]|uniref:Uncharacterized protein n=1 Tax=Myotis brandtii TaxID=109478 RepID=S7MSU0_MYOBR|nr:hypothetical protein D623_10020643 [Myotis brandtii]